jgi:hypothetical protein
MNPNFLDRLFRLGPVAVKDIALLPNASRTWDQLARAAA